MRICIIIVCVHVYIYIYAYVNICIYVRVCISPIYVCASLYIDIDLVAPHPWAPLLVLEASIHPCDLGSPGSLPHFAPQK